MQDMRVWYRILGLFSWLLIWLLAAPGYQFEVQAQSSPVTRSELIQAMNTLRVSRGLPPLIEDPIVNSVAQATAEIMAANYMSWHIGDVRGRIQAAGYGGGAKVWATENFAVGFGNMGVDEVMQAWADPDHMRPAVNPAYCHVGAGVAQAGDGRYYYILQAAYVSGQACGEYESVPGDGDDGTSPPPPVSQIIIPVEIAKPDPDGRTYHIVRSGQSFWSIAIAYQITIRDLEIWNNLSSENGLLVGQELFIPSSNTEGYATPTPVGMVLLATPDADGVIVHEVQPYQALFTIADAYRVTVDRLLALNGWQADWPLQIGQNLLIDPGNVTPSPTPRPLTPIEKLTPESDGNYYHTVVSGQFLAGIADLYEINLGDLMAWNNLSADSIILPGQRLLLRVTPPATATPVATTPVPVTPSATARITETPVPPTASMTALPSISETVEAEVQAGIPGIGLLVGVGLVMGSLLLIGWAARRR